MTLVGVFNATEEAAAADKTIQVGTVTVFATKSNGAAWDVGGGAPDIFVQIRVKKAFGSRKSTSVKKNTYSATFSQNTVKIRVGQAIEIKVWDKDFASDDIIGSATYVIDAATFNRGSVTFRSFGRVRSMSISLR